MFVYGKAGRKAPYAIKILTQMQISKLLVSKKTLGNSSISIVIAFLTFSDSTDQ
jgi:hypothetical protein